jgi:hypothetical protein
MAYMADTVPSKRQLKALAKQINKDQATSSPAEKRVKIPMSFNKAIKKMGRARPPKK